MKINDFTSVIEKKPELLSVSLEDETQTHLLRALHTHDDRVEILLIREGFGIHTVGGKLYQTKAGDILIYNANVLHDEEAATKDGMEILSCSIKDVKLAGLPPNCLMAVEGCPVIQEGAYSAEVEALLRMLYTAEREPGKFTAETKELLLCSLVLVLHRAAARYACQGASKGIELGHRIQAYIDEHYKEDILLADMAREIGINQYYLAHVFKKTTGYAPMQYVIRRRIGEAQSWLLMTEKNVTEIAYLVGYNSASHFNNAFRRVVGMAPQKYRGYWRGNGNSHRRTV